jgi:hypothetical protein
MGTAKHAGIALLLGAPETFLGSLTGSCHRKVSVSYKMAGEKIHRSEQFKNEPAISGGYELNAVNRSPSLHWFVTAGFPTDKLRDNL